MNAIHTIIAIGSLATLCAATHAGVEGGIRCWGYNVSGQCNVPSGLPLMAWVEGGANHTIALQNNGVVRAWGLNTYGQSNVPTNLGVVVD
ncbi:MAG: RCC1 domain-containing protein, partial [Bacteroidia bacterium]|nr:RCC1 domain-containing protein [Bacteroidia bacterium]